MIPLSDEAPIRRRFPFFNICLLLTCCGVFAYQLSLPEPALRGLFATFGVVPAEIASGQDLPPPNPWPIWTTLVTSMFLHGGWLHLLGNMLYLWIFGDNVESAAGHFPYLVFYVVCGIAAGLAQVVSSPTESLPGIGASGAIAGILGSYLLLHPGAKVTTIVLLGGFPLRVPLPAFLLIGIWFLLQLQGGVGSVGPETQQTSGVAYWAHIGGFLTGLIITALVLVFRSARGQIPSASAAIPPSTPHTALAPSRPVLPPQSRSLPRLVPVAATPVVPPASTHFTPPAPAPAPAPVPLELHSEPAHREIGNLLAEIIRHGNVFHVHSAAAEQVAAKVNLDSDASVEEMHSQLEQLGVYDALRQAGIEPGDTIQIGDLELDWS